MLNNYWDYLPLEIQEYITKLCIQGGVEYWEKIVCEVNNKCKIKFDLEKYDVSINLYRNFNLNVTNKYKVWFVNANSDY